MKKLNTLKIFIDYLYRFCLLAFVGTLIFVPMYLFEIREAVTSGFKINGIQIHSMDKFTKIVIVLSAIGSVFFMYSIYLLRKTVYLFINKDVFNIQIIKYLNTIGKCIIATGLFTNIPSFIYSARDSSHPTLEFNPTGYYPLLFLICLGLFFMVLSEVFKMAKQLKEENELTI